ncbi:MBL fold metallo-hydrolase [Fodinibius salsisoli]|uniref:MBL fold metallo-hydrolase n=1 Tax=Fodinibius salsisoli TaxID=2820877 RepID=A0ABT3PSA4_9BACT|nr:MBL fold metallo-hydrolase [Fodinibius salsisoli]MCW9708748.1 MBL fold metallo-hydrolase [Fodinibius salsisoli]
MGDQLSCKITFWGVRGSTPCADPEHMAFGGNTTCVQIHIPGSDEQLILDSGTGIRKLGNKLSGQNQNIRGHIFITHPHRDHLQGFPFFRPLYSSGNNFEIHMPEQEQGSCREIFTEHHSKTFFPVSLDMMNAHLTFVDQPPERTTYEGFEVEFMRANHSTNTAIYKFHLDGRQLIFAPDNELVPEDLEEDWGHKERIREFFQDADILIHDAQYDLEAYKHKQGWGHSAWQQVIKVARETGVAKLLLTHHDPSSDDEKLYQLDEHIQEEYGAYFDIIELAKEGDTSFL